MFITDRAKREDRLNYTYKDQKHVATVLFGSQISFDCEAKIFI